MMVRVLLFNVIVLTQFIYYCKSEPLLRYARPKCKTDADCQTNAFCFGNDNNVIGYCKCQNGYEMFSKDRYYECLRESKLGGFCKRDVQCQISAGTFAICSSSDSRGTCICNSTISHPFDNNCYETKLLDDFCQVDANCLLSENPIGEDKHGICLYGVCSCPFGKRPSLSRKSCIETKEMNEKCNNDLECQSIDYAVCREFCTCEAGFVRSLDGRKCLRAALKFDEPCTENSQCTRYLEKGICINNKCTCPSHFHGYETKCKRDTKPGEVCFDDGDCIIFKELENIVNCTKGVCTCKNGKSYDERLCLPNASFVLIQNNYLIFMISITLLFWYF